MEAAGLDPRIGEVALAVLAEKDHSADGRDLAALVVREESQRRQIAADELTVGCERLGSRSEVEGFRVEPRHRLLVEALAPRVAAQLLDQLGVGAAVGRADPDVDAGDRPLPD
jgi:hypothetical protein